MNGRHHVVTARGPLPKAAEADVGTASNKRAEEAADPTEVHNVMKEIKGKGTNSEDDVPGPVPAVGPWDLDPTNEYHPPRKFRGLYNGLSPEALQRLAEVEDHHANTHPN